MAYGDSANWDGTIPPAAKEIVDTVRDQSESFLSQIFEFLSQLWHMIF